MTDTIDTLAGITDQALSDAKDTLTAAWRLASSNVYSDTPEHVAAEMGALTEPLGTITRIRRRRRSTDRSPADQLVADVVDYNNEAEEREAQAQAARDRRDEAIREALTHDGMSAQRIADALDMHVQRIYQIKRGERA